jgi:hypothetical protein
MEEETAGLTDRRQNMVCRSWMPQVLLGYLKVLAGQGQ